MAPPNQGFRYRNSLSAAASDNTGVLVAPCGASRGGGIQLSGTWVGTVLFEQTLDNGTTWIAKTVYPAAGGAGVTSAAANGQWKFACGGETHVRARCSAFTSGAIVVDATFTAGVDAGVTGSGVQGVSGGTPLPVEAWGFSVTLTPTVTNGAYSAGDIMGGLLTFANVAQAIDKPFVLQEVQFGFKAAVTPSLLIVFLEADPTGTTQTDNAVYSLAAADTFKVVAALPVNSLGGYLTDHGTPNTIRLGNLGIPMKPVSGTRNILALLVDLTGVTLTSTADLRVRVGGV